MSSASVNEVLEAITEDAAAGRRWAARSALRSLLSQQPAPSPQLARSCERLGLSSQGVAIWQKILQEDPDDTEAWASLMRLHAELGQTGRVTACQTALRRLRGAPDSDNTAPTVPEPEDTPGASWTDADLVRMAVLFAGREEIHARMWKRSGGQIGYSPAAAPLTPEVIDAHLRGDLTVGSYLLRADETVGMLVLDLDADKAALQAALGDRHRLTSLQQAFHTEGLRLLTSLRRDGLDPLLEDSGYKGRHLWIFLEEPLPAPQAHHFIEALARKLAPADPRLKLEAFPRQGQLTGKGYGNLIKLPLGVHLRSGRRSAILGDDGQPLSDPFARMRAIRKSNLTHWMPALETVASEDAPPGPGPEPAPPVVPAPLPAPWREIDFSQSPRVSTVLRGCPVLQKLVEQTLEKRTLSRDESLVLKHTLGQIPEGVQAVNYLFDRVPDYPRSQRLKRVLRGNPVSCDRIRSRVPRLAEQHCADCVFPEAPGAYEHPLRHLPEAPDTPVPTCSPAELLARYTRLQERILRLQGERDGLRLACLEVVLREGPVAVAGGCWSVTDLEGLPVLGWSPEGEE